MYSLCIPKKNCAPVFAGEPQLVPGPPRGVPPAAGSALQLPGGRRPHQLSHDPGHTGHESPAGRFATTVRTRMRPKKARKETLQWHNEAVLKLFYAPFSMPGEIGLYLVLQH